MISYHSFIQTKPFINTSVSVADGEGLCYVPEDDTFWVADDNGRAVHEVRRGTGHLIRRIKPEFKSVVKIGSNELSGSDRCKDIEAIAHNHEEQALYVFSAESASGIPTCFRLIRECNSFRLDSWQPLTLPFTGAAYNDGTIWVTNGRSIYSYDYGTNLYSLFHTFDESVYGKFVFGLSFYQGDKVWMVTNLDKAFCIDWPSMTPVMEIELTQFDIFDARGIEQIGSQVFIIDGYSNPPDPSKRNAVHVLEVS